MKYWAKAQNGSLNMGSDLMRENFRKFLLNHEGVKIEFNPVLPESRKQRGFYHGAVLPLWAYLNNWDYHDKDILDFLHHEAKKEFNGEMVMMDKKMVVRGKSTKGELGKGFLERVVDYLVDNYGINPMSVLNPEMYKDFRDRIYGNGQYEDYISYLEALNLLKR